MESLQYSYSDQFHILRHFSQIDEDYRIELKTNTGYTDEEISAQLALTGSKFHPVFVSNPIQLWKKIQSHKKFIVPDTRDWKEDRFIVTLFYEQADYTGGIGEDSLIRLDNLLPAERALLKKQDRDGLFVNHVQTTRTNPTWQVNVVLWKEPELLVRTIFPGIYAPPFPNAERQKETEMMESKGFWDQYALNYL